MKARIRHFHSPDLDLDTESPADTDDFEILVQMMVSPVDAPSGEESFDVVVCTPVWVAREVQRSGFLVGRHHLVVGTYDAAAIRAHLTRQVEACEAGTWEELGQLIGRIGKWEFEDYVA